MYYYLDDSTPYLSVVPVADGAITLGDFKKVFNRKGYKYFCKQLDKAIGWSVLRLPFFHSILLLTQLLLAATIFSEVQDEVIRS